MALSDGATSAKYAKEAAETTVNAIINYFEDNKLEDFLLNNHEEQKNIIIAYILRRLIALAKDVGCSNPREFSATMLFLVSNGKKIIIGHLGDGAIFLANPDNEILFTSAPDNMNGISNRTYFAVSADAIDHFRIVQLDLDEINVSQALMTSDGAYLMFYNRGNHDSSKTASELLSYANSEIITTNEDLRAVLQQMAEVASERLDDWSIIICNQKQKRGDYNVEPISMLSEELEKMHN